MELIDSIRKRRSIRKFKNDPVPREAIDELLEAARLAPSGSNLQPWRFVVLESEEAKMKLDKVTPYTFAVRAPVLLVCCADLTAMNTRGKRVQELRDTGAFTGVDMEDPNAAKYGRTLGELISGRGYLAMNVAIAVEHMALRAVDLGLGTCWLARFDIEETAKILDLGEEILPVALLPVGYPDQFPGQRPRLPKDQILLKTI